jgi:hypothetical protein
VGITTAATAWNMPSLAAQGVLEFQPLSLLVGGIMDRYQHITQDAAEHYAVYVMAKYAEDHGLAKKGSSEIHWKGFLSYLENHSWSFQGDFATHYPDYKINVDSQVPLFLERIRKHLNPKQLKFEIDEAHFRNLGKKADFTITIDESAASYFVSLKNYIGSSGITRPQVSAGTFLSFACGFVFDRNGVGTYDDPRFENGKFKGSNQKDRNGVLAHLGMQALESPLQTLEDLQAFVRSELLTIDDYDQSAVKKVVANIVPRGQEAILEIFSSLGIETVRAKFLERIGLDGTEDLLYFDNSNSLDSITNLKFHDLVTAINDPDTVFSVTPVGQSLRFSYKSDKDVVLQADVPLTVNTNGAWYRPKVKYSGTHIYSDKGHAVALRWGQLRPYKSREIATSTNLYVDLKATGIFEED